MVKIDVKNLPASMRARAVDGEKSATLTIRVRPKAKARWERAAVSEGYRSLTAFVEAACEEKIAESRKRRG